MDKHRKAVIELCAAIDLADENVHEGQNVMLKPGDWRAIRKLVAEIKAGFNHAMDHQFEQHYLRERDYRGMSKPKEGAA